MGEIDRINGEGFHVYLLQDCVTQRCFPRQRRKYLRFNELINNRAESYLTDL